MASLCYSYHHHNPRPPTAVPSKSPISGGAIVRTSASILRTSPLCVSSAKTPSGPPKAVPSQKYVYPDPIAEFAAAETQRFKAELLKKLSKEKDTFGDELQTVVDVCAEVFSEFLHKEYGGPGTLLFEPFTDMMVRLKEQNLPGAPLAARASLLWAQNHTDHDWEIWNSKSHK